MVFEKRNIGKLDFKIPCLGVGCAPLGGNFVDIDNKIAEELIEFALKSGIDYFDTAPWYGFGRSERVVGDQIRSVPHLISSKVGRILKPGKVQDPSTYGMVNPLPFNPIYDYTYSGIMRSYEDGLQRLGLSKIHLLLVHDIGTFQHGKDNIKHFSDLKASGYRALEELRSNGDVDAIGLGVNENDICIEALKMGSWDVFLLAGRYTLLEQTPLEKLFPACQAVGTSVICGGPFNSGVLVGREMWNYAAAPEHVKKKVNSLYLVAQKYNVPIGAAAIQFPLANPIISSVIPGPRSKKELQQILDWFFLEIPIEFWADLKDQMLIHEEAPTSYYPKGRV